MNNQFEIYNLMKIIRPDYIPQLINFCYRYCDPVKRKNGVEFLGRSFHSELELIYKKRFAMVRKREDVKIELPLL
jgi:hypothetical protein